MNKPKWSNPNPFAVYNKAMKVFKSCKTSEQLKVAVKFGKSCIRYLEGLEGESLNNTGYFNRYDMLKSDIDTQIRVAEMHSIKTMATMEKLNYEPMYPKILELISKRHLE